MVADASIYRMIREPQPLPNPMEQMGQVMQLRNLMGQGKMQDMQMRDAEDSRARQGQLRDLFARGNVTPEQVMGIDPATGLKFQKSQAEERNAQANLLAQDDKLVKSFSEQGKQELMAITTPEQWQAYRALQMQRVSMLSTPQYKQAAMQAMQQMPEQFDPQWLQSKLAAEAPIPAGHTRLPGGGLSPVDPNYLAGRTQVAAAGAPKVTVPIDQRGQGKFADTVGAKSGERLIAQHETVESAAGNLEKLDLTLKQIADSDAITGFGAEILKNIERMKHFVTESEKSGKRVSDTELLDSLLGSDVFPMIKALGIGARGLDTPAEREFLRQVMTGTTPMNKATLLRMTEIRRNVAVRAIEGWNKKVESGELDNYFAASGMPKQTIPIPPAPEFKTGSGPTAGGAIKPAAPQLGAREGGYIYRGGDPSKPSSWERAR